MRCAQGFKGDRLATPEELPARRRGREELIVYIFPCYRLLYERAPMSEYGHPTRPLWASHRGQTLSGAR